MAETKPIRAVEMVRRIRDDLARELTGRSDAEIIAFYNKAGEAVRESAKRDATIQLRTPALQPTARGSVKRRD